MLILAMECSAAPASAAVCSDGALLGQYFQNSKMTHSQTLLPMAKALLDSLGLSLKELGLIAVSHGPGSFTGLRIGVSAVKGLAWGLDIPVCGVSTLEAMAYQLPEAEGTLCPAMYARNNNVYNALFKWADGKLTRVCKDRAISLDSLASELATLGGRYTILGDGALLSRGFLSAAGVDCNIAPALTMWQTAYGVALAAMQSEPLHPSMLEPVYLRPSQAERSISKKC